MEITCPNCEYPLSESFKYCPHCAQKTNLHRISLHEIMHDLVHYFTHADKGLFRLLKDLSLRTGTVAKEFVSGKRKKYFPPLNFFLIVATLYVLVMSFITAPPSGDVLKNHPEISKIPDSRQREKVIAIYTRQEKANYFLGKYSNVISMIAAPLICMVYWLFYLKGKYNYTEHLVASMYMTAFTNLIYVVIIIPVFALINLRTSYAPVAVLMVFQIVYNSVFYYQFISKNTVSSALKATAASICAILFWVVFSGLLISTYISNGLWGLLN